jgi:hypothetical protein
MLQRLCTNATHHALHCVFDTAFTHNRKDYRIVSYLHVNDCHICVFMLFRGDDSHLNVAACSCDVCV